MGRASEIKGTKEKQLTRWFRIFKIQIALWKFKLEKKMGGDTILATVKVKIIIIRPAMTNNDKQ